MVFAVAVGMIAEHFSRRGSHMVVAVAVGMILEHLRRRGIRMVTPSPPVCFLSILVATAAS